jgi:ABC-type Mn2+/Zn2+ transport system permease subunit
MSEVFELDFFRRALLASLLIGVTLSVMGVYVVLRRIIFVGAALAQMSAAGVALGILLGVHGEAVGMVAALLGVALLSIHPKKVGLPGEGPIGIGYALASTLAILFVAKTPGGEADTLLLLYGNILAVPDWHLLELWVLAPALVLLHVLLRRRFLVTCFSPDAARASGVRVGAWTLLLYVTLGTGIAAGMEIAGSLLTFTYLVVPALAGQMLARRSWHMPAIAVAVAVVGTIAGLAGSVLWDLPSGPTIVAALCAEAGAAWSLARLLA